MPLRKCHSGFQQCCVALIFFLAIAPNMGWGQSIARLPLAAQAALNKGIIAAKVPDYLLAIRFFEEARKLAPQAPVIFLNMGLAESRIPGRELRAIAWFGAYLAAYPDAPNAAAVKEQIAVLDVRNQSNISRLIKSVQDAATQKLPDPPKGSLQGPGEESDQFLYYAAELWIDAGDISAALKTISLFNDSKPESIFSSKSLTLRNIAIAQAESGDIAAAIKTADLIRNDRGRTQALQNIAIFQAKSGNIAGAEKTADLIKGAWEKSWAQSAIANVQAKAGDTAGAQKNFISSLMTADLVLDAGNKSRLQVLIAEGQIDGGDLAGAQRTLAEAQKTAERIKEEQKKEADKSIAAAQAKLGIASAAGSPRTPPSAQTVVTVSDWLKRLDDDNEKSDCPLNTDPFLDLADYLKSLPARWAKRYPGAPPASGNPQQIFEMLKSTAETIVKAQKVIHQMLNQRAK